MKRYKPMKNPRKYVETLKRQLEEAWGYAKKLETSSNEERGKHWFNYSSDVHQPVLLDTSYARECRIDSQVTIKGRVIEIKPGKDRGMWVITFSLGEVRVVKE